MTFISYSGYVQENITMIIDRFERGSYCSKTEGITIAEGPGGYFF